MSDYPDQASLKQRQQLREISQGFRQCQVLPTCVELGVFEAMETQPYGPRPLLSDSNS
jgi:hypothetical protein